MNNYGANMIACETKAYTNIMTKLTTIVGDSNVDGIKDSSLSETISTNFWTIS